MRFTLVTSMLALGFSLLAFGADMPAGTNPEWMKYTTPGAKHAVLKDLAGKFSYTMQWWEKADGPAQNTKGTVTGKLAMGGRFLEQETTGLMMGQKFTGKSVLGFDAVGEKYQSVWYDGMTTAMMYSTGTMDDTNTLTSTGTFSCPMTGEKEAWFRTELKVLNKNAHTFAMFQKTREGKEYKSMEISYKRLN